MPSSVVKSIMAAAIFNPLSLAVVLMLRLVKAAARSSAMTWSTVGMSNPWELRIGKAGRVDFNNVAVFVTGRKFGHAQTASQEMRGIQGEDEA